MIELKNLSKTFNVNGKDVKAVDFSMRFQDKPVEH